MELSSGHILALAVALLSAVLLAVLQPASNL